MNNTAWNLFPRLARAAALLFFFCTLFPLFADEPEDPTQALKKVIYEYDNYVTSRMSDEELNTRAASLLNAGANPNTYYRDSETFLRWAVKKGKAELVRLLLDHGADPNMEDSLKQTALETRGITSEIQKLLLEAGADPNHRDYSGKSVLFNRLQLFWDWIGGSGYGYNPSEEDLIAFTDLLEAGARPADTDDKGNSALLFLMDKSRQYPRLVPLLDLVLQYVSADEEETAKAKLAVNDKENLKKRHKDSVNEKLGPAISVLLLPLSIGGLSILMRENIYADNKSDNFMGRVNGALTLGTGFMFLGFIAGAKHGDNVTERVGSGLLGGAIGTVVGILIACLPPVYKAFNKYPVLYYTPTALSTIFAGYVIYDILIYR